MDSGHGASKCTRKAALSFFFLLELLAFTVCLASVLSPTWQFVYLENGRTEHHHGLWLDCKRDFSFDYGRTREYYETLYRRDLQGSPFEMFFLPPLECVYKFDYYIDPEDLYDHDHDENRLQDDAYQHLFLGHKIAALVACGVAVVLGAIALLLGICAFCHRTFIAAMTVLVTMAAILSAVGLSVFFAWGNYQDNKLIKQRDENETYEQALGWAFHFQVAGMILHFVASIFGCLAASVAAVKGRAKLVRVDQVVEGGSQSTDLLSGMASTSNLAAAKEPFKRSFSAIYRVDSAALQRWEKDYMRNVKQAATARCQQEEQEAAAFQRTKSMPMLTKQQRKAALRQTAQASAAARSAARASSSSNLFLSSDEPSTGTTNTLESFGRPPPSIPTPEPPKPPLKSALKTPHSGRRFGGCAMAAADDSATDSTYEYLPCDQRARPSRDEDYDVVYSATGDAYLQPNSRLSFRASSSTLGEEQAAAATRQPAKVLFPSLPPPSGSSQSIPLLSSSTRRRLPASTLIDDAAAPAKRPLTTTFNAATRQTTAFPAVSPPVSSVISQERRRIEEFERLEEMQQSTRRMEQGSRSKAALLPPADTRPPTAPKPPLTARDIAIGKPAPGFLTALPSSSFGELSRSVREEDDESPAAVCLNVFGDASELRGSQKSLTSLAWRPSAGGVDIFERPNSEIDPTPLPGRAQQRQPIADMRKRILIGTLLDEVDRSVGTSTLLGNDEMKEAASSSPSVSSYARDAEFRLNLFLADRGCPSSSAGNLPTPSPKPPSTIMLCASSAISTSGYATPKAKPAKSEAGETTV